LSPVAGFAYLFHQESSHLASAVFLSPCAAFLLRHPLLALQKNVLASGIILIIVQFICTFSFLLTFSKDVSFQRRPNIVGLLRSRDGGGHLGGRNFEAV
jgi:hypothetical protein